MKVTKTGIGLTLAVIYLGVFGLTVCLTLFDNREGCGTLFPGMVTFPWSLMLKSVHCAAPLDMGLALLLRLPGALLNAWIIYYLFRRADTRSESKA